MLDSLITSVLVARLLVPAESAAEGHTLWLTQLMIALAVAGSVVMARRGNRLCLDALDAGILVIVAGHVLSAIIVIVTEGQKRALNMLWEWAAIGLFFIMARRVLARSRTRASTMAVLISLTASLACLGLWQHFVVYRQTVAKYEGARVELDALLREDSASLSAHQAFRVRRLTRELQDQGAPLEGRLRILWEQRLAASREPSGSFALTNTFAGLLAVGLLLLLPIVVEQSEAKTSLPRRVLLILIAGLTGYCLVLTKSRTAWCGFTIAGLVWLIGRYRFPRGRVAVRVGAIAVGVLATFTTIAALTGGFDREVIFEAPKSLAYRFQYWQGTARMIAQRPIFGVGPGNFRAHYLKYKPAEASEEISDPHNLLLDAWTSGGLAAVLGLAAAAAIVLRARSATRSNPQDVAPGMGVFDRTMLSTGVLSIVLGFGFALLHTWFVAGSDTWRLLTLAAISLTVLVSLNGSRASKTSSAGAGLLALLIHLLGAGGLQMPAIAMTLAILLAAICPARRERGRPGVGVPQWFVAGLCVVLFVGCAVSATLPHLRRDARMTAGDFEARRGNLQAARRQFTLAADADPLSPAPHERLAGLLLVEWRRSGDSNDESFDRAAGHLERARERDPLNPNRYRALGELFLRRGEMTNDIEDAHAARRALEKAVAGYPTSPEILMALANAWLLSGDRDRAVEPAAQALRLDKLNRDLGHGDRYLRKSDLDRLKEIVQREYPVRNRSRN